MKEQNDTTMTLWAERLYTDTTPICDPEFLTKVIKEVIEHIEKVGWEKVLSDEAKVYPSLLKKTPAKQEELVRARLVNMKIREHFLTSMDFEGDKLPIHSGNPVTLPSGTKINLKQPTSEEVSELLEELKGDIPSTGFLHTSRGIIPIPTEHFPELVDKLISVWKNAFGMDKLIESYKKHNPTLVLEMSEEDIERNTEIAIKEKATRMITLGEAFYHKNEWLIVGNSINKVDDPYALLKPTPKG